jgi:hypothetical protein
MHSRQNASAAKWRSRLRIDNRRARHAVAMAGRGRHGVTAGFRRQNIRESVGRTGRDVEDAMSVAACPLARAKPSDQGSDLGADTGPEHKEQRCCGFDSLMRRRRRRSDGESRRSQLWVGPVKVVLQVR